MFDSIKKFFEKRSLDSLEADVAATNALEPEIMVLDDAALTAESMKLKERIAQGENLDALLPRAFALAREAARRTLGQRPYDVQLMGGMALHKGSVAEMMTGEGKTLSGVAPAYLNGLTGKGVHIVTVNEYLARREWRFRGNLRRPRLHTERPVSDRSADVRRRF